MVRERHGKREEWFSTGQRPSLLLSPFPPEKRKRTGKGEEKRGEWGNGSFHRNLSPTTNFLTRKREGGKKRKKKRKGNEVFTMEVVEASARVPFVLLQRREEKGKRGGRDKGARVTT